MLTIDYFDYCMLLVGKSFKKSIYFCSIDRVISAGNNEIIVDISDNKTTLIISMVYSRQSHLLYESLILAQYIGMKQYAEQAMKQLNPNKELPYELNEHEPPKLGYSSN